MTIHFRRPKPPVRCASERIADRRRVDTTAELKAELRGRGEMVDATDLKSVGENRAGSNPAARTTQPWYVGNREFGEDT